MIMNKRKYWTCCQFTFAWRIQSYEHFDLFCVLQCRWLLSTTFWQRGILLLHFIHLVLVKSGLERLFITLRLLIILSTHLLREQVGEIQNHYRWVSRILFSSMVGPFSLQWYTEWISKNIWNLVIKDVSN